MDTIAYIYSYVLLSYKAVDQININLDNYLLPTYEHDKMSLFISSLYYGRTEIRGVFIIAKDGSMFPDLDQNNFSIGENSDYWI